MGIGTTIKKRRQELGLTQEELAKKLGYKNKASINKIESGVSDITQSKVVEFARALETTVSYLMDWDDGEISKLQNAQQQANVYNDIIETELAPLIDLDLTRIEAKEVVRYAKYIVNQRGNQ